MTVTDPISYDPPVKIIRRRGRILVGALAGAFALTFCLWLFGYAPSPGPISRRFAVWPENALLIVCSTVAAAIVTQWLWDQFVQVKRAFSWGWSVFAGVLAIPLTTYVALVAFYIVTEIIALNTVPADRESLRGPLSYGLHPLVALPLHLLFLGVVPFLAAGLAALFGLLVAALAVPLAIGACLIGTAWARRRLRDAGLTSYASPQGKGRA